jgi:hypothetical protein
VDLERLREHLDTLLATTEAISHQLGYRSESGTEG